MLRIRIKLKGAKDTDPHQSGRLNLDTDPHQSDKLDPDQASI